MKITVYQSYTIKPCPQQDQTCDQWMSNVDIYWTHNGMSMMRSFIADSRYATEADAELCGITYGQDIIDGKIDGISLV